MSEFMSNFVQCKCLLINVIMKMSTINTLRRCLLSMLLAGGMAVPSCAQNNPQLINDSFYPMYVKAYNLRKSAACLAIADSLHAAAVASGDRHGEVYALSIPFLYEFYRPKNLSGLERAMKPFQGKAKEYGYTGLYYYAISMKVAYLTREHRYIEAFVYLNRQRELAEKQGDVDGIVSQFRMLGVIQHFRGELSQAVSSYAEAIENYKKYNRPRYISREYLSIADCYRMMCDYERLLDAADKALPHCVLQSDRNNVYIYKAYAYFMLGRDGEFVGAFDYLDKNSRRAKLDNSYVIMNNALKACKAIYDSRDADALRLIDAIGKSSPEESYRLYVAYYKRKGDFPACIKYMQKIMDARNDQEEETLLDDRRSVDNIFRDQHVEAERQRIIRRNTQLQLANMQMSLRNSSLELGRRRDAASMAKAAADRNQLSYNNQQLAARQLRDSIAAQQLVQLAKDRHMRMERFVYLVVLAMSALVMLMTVAYTMRKRLLAKKLRAANAQLNDGIAQLNIARDKALESDRMKTLFIQNMSHEIRTPLNAIVGFSQLVTSPDSGLSASEKKDMAHYIADNSELLTTLVNDIIDISALQSGNFSMNMEQVAVNAMCRETLETVRHRLQPGVSLEFNTGVEDSFRMLTDSHRVRQVLINMLTNAEKNTSEGSIVLACSAAENIGSITFSVADTGIGVPKERQKEIFMRFHKLDVHKQGTGLGLDICRNIARCLGGSIDIDPEYTGGARFWFTVPIKE